MTPKKRFLAFLALGAVSLASGGDGAFKLQALGSGPADNPLGVADRQARGFLMQFSSDIHERITRQAYVKAILEDKVLRLEAGARDAQPGRCFELRFDPSAESSTLDHPTVLDPACRNE